MATHILVVDDETAIADLVEVYLKNEGFTIHKFYNASDALACVRTTRLDLAVLDVMLPMRKNKTPSAIVEMRSGNCKLQNKGRPFKNE